jgi:transcriptional regulator with XRE-family HTH domain
MDPKDAATAKVRELGGFIREQRKAAQLSLRNLASLAGVSNPYLSQIERGLRKPSAEILQSIAQALRISSETLYVKAGILEQQHDDLAARILSDPSMSEKQKRALLEVYQSFRHEQEAEAEGQVGADLTLVADEESSEQATGEGERSSQEVGF